MADTKGADVQKGAKSAAIEENQKKQDKMDDPKTAENINNNNRRDKKRRFNRIKKKITPRKSDLSGHPLKEILRDFRPNECQLTPAENNKDPVEIDDTPLVEITTKEGLELLIATLAKETEFGIDVEHSDHGYLPVTCLIQISTQSTDYIIDCLAVKDHLALLQPTLANVDILKIFHDPREDLKWLQEDFKLFVAGMFDTQMAIKFLGGKNLGLADELLKYNIRKDDSLTRYDFRNRPLPKDIIYYARADTHFLIHMYNRLKSELHKKDLLYKLYKECNKLCKVVYEPFRDNYFNVVEELKNYHKRQIQALEKLNKTSPEKAEEVGTLDDLKSFQERQLKALEKLNQWRHDIAKSEDINPGKVLSRNAMKNLFVQFPRHEGDVVKTSRSKHVQKAVEEVYSILSEVKPTLKDPVKMIKKPPSEIPENKNKLKPKTIIKKTLVDG